MWNMTRNSLLALALVSLLSACGSGKDEGGGGSSHVARKAVSPAEQLSRSLVSGVTQTKPGSAPLPVQVKFALQAKPEPAQPLDVTISITPTASNLDRVFGKVEGEEGLELVSSGELEGADRPPENTPIERTVKVLAKQDGIYTLTATVSVDMGGSITSQTYVFPVIAGSGMPDLPANVKSAAAAKPQPSGSPHPP
jgi:hypothetical protein